VTQSSFANPCTPEDGGFNTGFHPVAANSTDAPPTQTYTVSNAVSDDFFFFLIQDVLFTEKSELVRTLVVLLRTRYILTTLELSSYLTLLLSGEDTAASHCGKGMIFSINCPADPAPNSFANFKKKALEIGAQLAAANASASASGAASATDGGYGGYGGSSAAATQTWSGYAAGTTVYSAAYGDATVPPPASVATVTQTVSLDSKVWTTTYASYPNSPDPTPNAQPNVIPVKVGANAQLVFDPPRVDAKPGDIISFVFQGANHSVTQSSFADPCRRPVNASTGTVGGWDSGFQFVGNSTDLITVNMTVNDTA
jgi:plastocyanin